MRTNKTAGPLYLREGDIFANPSTALTGKPCPDAASAGEGDAKQQIKSLWRKSHFVSARFYSLQKNAMKVPKGRLIVAQDVTSGYLHDVE
jgi:hypothetical protein